MKLTVGLAACLLLVAAEGKDKKKTDDTISGVYKIATLTFAGNDVEDWKGYKFAFKGDKLKRDAPDGEANYTFKVDTSKKPAEIDLKAEDGELKGKTLKGIYSIKGAELKVCIPISPDTDRPKEFASKDGEQIALIILKSDKP